MKEHILDAKGKILGRVASEAAFLLRGKDDPSFAPNTAPSLTVKIINASKVKITEKKLKTKEYVSYTGYPGGLNKATAEEVAAKKGYSELFTKAVSGMLPNNKLKSIMMKNLIITE